MGNTVSIIDGFFHSQLESSLTKVPIHGRVDRNSRRHKVSNDIMFWNFYALY